MEAEVLALRAQISPHFIYNALNAIASFVRTDPDRARQLLLDFADFTRYSFQRHGEYTTLEEELRSIERYLVLEQARFGERLQVTLTVAPEVLPVTVPVLSLQPLVENAIRHGVGPRLSGGRIAVTAAREGTRLLLRVSDDGLGLPKDWSMRRDAGVGLRNTAARLEQLYPGDHLFRVTADASGGVEVRIDLPWRISRADTAAAG
jgi:two-component system LytT family sensor kinase